MKVFLTGATGFVGRHVLRALRHAGHGVTALLLPAEDPTLVSGLARIVRGDITRPETLNGSLAGHEAVVHLAGAVGYGVSWNACVRLNREGTRNTAAAALGCGVRRFVHMSSVSVYGRVPDVPVDEDFPLRRIGDPYGDTKVDAEELLRGLAERKGLQLTVIRPTVIYGPGDTLFLPKLVENLRSGSARVIGAGENEVNLIHARDAAQFVAAVVGTERSVGRVYNLTRPGNPTWKTLLEAVATTLGLPPPRKHIPYPAAMAVAGLMELASRLTGRPPRLTRYAVRNVGRSYGYVADRMREELGFEPAVDTLEGVCACARELADPTPGPRA